MKLNTKKISKQSPVRFAAAVLYTLSILNAGAATAGGFGQVKPFEYSTGKSESLTSLYAHWTPLQGHQQRSSATLVNSPFMPSLVPQLLAKNGEPASVRSFSSLDPGGYYRVSSLEGEEPSKAESAVYTVLGLGILGGAMYLRAKEIELGFAELKQ